MVKVLDFGLAKSLEASRSAATATTAMGSPLFMAPEQSSVGAPIRAATDVWALGLIAFFALTFVVALPAILILVRRRALVESLDGGTGQAA